MESLGINFLNIIVYSLIFLTLYLVLKIKFIPNIEKALSERQKIIEKGLSFAQELNQRKELIETERKNILAEAQKQKEEHLAIARKQIDEEHYQIVTSAKEKATQIIDEARNIVSLENKTTADRINKVVDEKTMAKIKLLASQGKLQVNFLLN